MATGVAHRFGVEEERLPHSFVRASAMLGSGNTLTTGYPALDGFIGDLRGGETYLFCSPNDSQFVDDLLHRLMVRACRDGRVAYMNNTDYYAKKTLLSADRLAYYAKVEGVEAHRVLEGIYFAAAYSKFRQPKAAGALKEMIGQEKETKLIVAHRMPAFLEDAADKAKSRDSLNRSLSALWRISIEKNLIMVVTAATSAKFNRPVATGLTVDLANVMIFFREAGNGAQVHATLLKHPAKGTPTTACIFESGGENMGRITPPFRQKYQELTDMLRRNYAGLLRDSGNREAFELLIGEAWDREHAAMGNSDIPLVLDALNLTANVHNQKEIQHLKAELDGRDKKIAALEERLIRLENAREPRYGEGEEERRA
jgi:hypothetical protein